jgi:hypothetical protein
VAEAFSAADENSVVSLDGSKHATVKPKWNLTRGFPLNTGRDRRNEFNIAKTESHSYRPRFLSYARVQRHSSVGRRQLDQPDWTNQRARLTASVCGLKRMTSLRDVMLHNVDMCGVGRTSSPSKDQA